MTPPLVRHQQSALVQIRRTYYAYIVTIRDPLDRAAVTTYYKASRRRLLRSAMECRAQEKAWVKAMYPRVFAQEYPNG